jgi:hypothetical protein
MIIKLNTHYYLELRKDRRMHQQKAYDEQQKWLQIIEFYWPF